MTIELEKCVFVGVSLACVALYLCYTYWWLPSVRPLRRMVLQLHDELAAWQREEKYADIMRWAAVDDRVCVDDQRLVMTRLSILSTRLGYGARYGWHLVGARTYIIALFRDSRKCLETIRTAQNRSRVLVGEVHGFYLNILAEVQRCNEQITAEVHR